jgi:uncharacterized membrane protein YraQ (UPF0718 family)
MKLLTGFAVFVIVVSLLADWRKTRAGVKQGIIMFLKTMPAILSVLVLVSMSLFLLPNEVIIKYLGQEAGITGYIFAALAGSIALIPGFIAYPLSGILVKTGISYPVIAIFITTLMMVGILTLPIEIRFFGIRASLIRNSLFFAAALIIGLLTGLFY